MPLGLAGGTVGANRQGLEAIFLARGGSPEVWNWFCPSERKLQILSEFKNFILTDLHWKVISQLITKNPKKYLHIIFLYGYVYWLIC
jgi:hypothetical protein